MVRILQDKDISTYRYLCEECDSTYVHKGDALNCERTCTLEEDELKALLGETESEPVQDWTEYDLSDDLT